VQSLSLIQDRLWTHVSWWEHCLLIPFVRNARGQSALRDLLNPLVRSILDDKNLQINTNPIEVYKQWINQTEAETGRPR